jgi:hypothetical protein
MRGGISTKQIFGFWRNESKCVFVNGIILAVHRPAPPQLLSASPIDRARDPHPNPGANSISIAPPLAEPAGTGVAPCPGATITGDEADMSLGGIVMLGPKRSSPPGQQRPRYVHNFEPLDLGTALITVHKGELGFLIAKSRRVVLSAAKPSRRRAEAVASSGQNLIAEC